MDQIRNILAAVGQFPQDDPVLTRAAEIAHAHRAKLTIVHIIDTLTGFDFVSTELGHIQHQMRLDAHESIEAAVGRLVGGVAEVDIRIETGSPSLRLTELTDEIKADLVVMRAHQGDSMLEKIIGSTTDRVIRTSRTPVLVVKRPATQEYQRVVLAIDTSDDSSAIVPFVATLLPLVGLNLLHVVHISSQFEAVMRQAGYGQASVTAHRDALIRNAKADMHAMSTKLANRPIPSATRVIVGDPSVSLVQSTWSPRVDLIVLGPGSTGRIRWALLGSVTRQVLRAATCDVLICRSAEQAAEK